MSEERKSGTNNDNDRKKSSFAMVSSRYIQMSIFAFLRFVDELFSFNGVFFQGDREKGDIRKSCRKCGGKEGCQTVGQQNVSSTYVMHIRHVREMLQKNIPWLFCWISFKE